MQLLICVLLGSAASIEDLWRRQISNLTVLAGLAAGLALDISLHGWRRGLPLWLGGIAAGFSVFLIFFLMGGLGGGDIKLMAAFGACLGCRQVVMAALLAAIAGAVMACAFLFFQRLTRSRRARGARAEDGRRALSTGDSIPYAPAIFAGTLLSFLNR